MTKLTVTGYFHGSLARFDFFDSDNGKSSATGRLSPPSRRGSPSHPARSRPINNVSSGRRDGVSVYRWRPAVMQRQSVCRRRALYRKKRSRSGRPKSQTPLHGHRLRTLATVYGHHQRTSSQQFYNKFATSQCQSPTSVLNMSRCWDVANFCPLVMFVAGVRSRCPCSGVWL